MSKVIVRIKGGLGNQLFCYAAARRLAMINNAELVIDDMTGFVRDCEHRRKYSLDNFNIRARKATPTERLEPFERYRRGLIKWLSRRKPFAERVYLEQDGVAFDPRVLTLRVKDSMYMDGLWQSENYFQDISAVIREDLRIIPPGDSVNQKLAAEIDASQAVCMHVRWFDAPGEHSVSNSPLGYYKAAVSLMEVSVKSPHYFVFSDNPDAIGSQFVLPKGRTTYVRHNQGDVLAFADLWLMTKCRHFITANSTFSWWGAWLSEHKGKIVATPDIVRNCGPAWWGFTGLIPSGWLKL